MIYVIDASVALKWFVSEEGCEKAVSLRSPGCDRLRA